MLLYCVNDQVVATHDDGQAVAPSLYGAAVQVIPVPNGTKLEKAGPPPRNPALDHRPYAIPAPTPDLLRAYAADKRWRAATGGTTVAGLTVATDDASQARIAQLKQAFDAGALLATTFKAADGSFVALNSTQATALYNGVVAHVQACHAAEAAAARAVNGATATTWADIDAFFAAVTPN